MLLHEDKPSQCPTVGEIFSYTATSCYCMNWLYLVGLCACLLYIGKTLPYKNFCVLASEFTLSKKRAGLKYRFFYLNSPGL
jgi:hypothetical protein